MTEKTALTMDIAAEEEMLNRLRNEDKEAWKQVYLKSVVPVQYMSTKKGVAYRDIMRDRDLNLETVYAILYEMMLAKDGLEKYDFRCPIIYWLRRCAGWIVLGECTEKAKDVSENADESYYIDSDSRDKWELVNYSFAEIWRNDPMSAYIYFLRRYEMMSSDDITKTFHISSIDNTYQLFSRTDKQMKSLLKKYGGGHR